MIAFRLAANELRRLTTGILPKLATLALVLVPVLYSATYLYANWDPYGNLDEVTAAIVNEDQPVTSDGKTVAAGDEVTANLKDSGTFDFQTVSAAKAVAGVKDGSYAFSITIPSGFSANLSSAAEFDPKQAVLQVTTNDANNYLVGTIVDRVSSSIHESIAKQIGDEAANKFLLGFSDIHGKLLEAADGAGQLADGASQLKSGADQLVAGTTQAQDGAQQLVDGQQQLLSGATTLEAGIGQLGDGIDQLGTGTQQLADGTAQLSSGATTLSDGLSTLSDKTSSLSSQTAALADGAQQVADGNAKIAGISSQVADAAQQAIADAPQARAALQAQLEQTGLPQDQIDQILAQVDTLVTPLQEANTTLQTANGQLQQLAGGAQQVADGAAQLADAAPQLADGIAQAEAGATQVASGATQVNDGAQALNTGAQQLATGVGQLEDGAAQLVAGEQQAVDGQQQLADGITALGDGAGALDDGIGQLLTGAGQLRDQLAQGAQSVPNPDGATREATADQIADPMAIQQNSLASAGNYGSGLAPFFLGLSLWVGAFTLFLLLKPLSTRALAGRAPAWQTAFGGWLPAAVFGIAQALAVFGVGVGLVGLEPQHPWLSLGILILTSMAFTAVIHGINARFGAVGKFLGLVLLILQLVSAGGTFPWETTPGPLHVLHEILPLGYVIDALRHTMYGGDLSAVGPDIAVLAVWWLIGIGLAWWSASTDRTWNLKRLRPELEL